MHWIGVLLCLAVALSQGKPSEDASEVALAKRLRYGDDGNSKIFKIASASGQIRVVMNGGKVVKVVTGGEQVEFYFHEGGIWGSQVQEFAVVRTEKQQLTYNEAKERCQRLGGDLPNLLNYYKDKMIWVYSQTWGFQTGFEHEDLNKVMESIMKITGEKFEKFWIGEYRRVFESIGNIAGEYWNCMKRSKGSNGYSITFGDCKSSIIDSFLCQLKRA